MAVDAAAPDAQDRHPDLDLFEHFPGLVDHDTKEHLRGILERRLMIQRCRSCGNRQHPPLPLCGACCSDDIEAEEVTGRGTVALVTWMHQGPPTPGVDYGVPHPVVAVDLEEQPGVRFTSTVVGCDRDRLRVGLAVALDWIERDGTPLPVFTPAR